MDLQQLENLISLRKEAKINIHSEIIHFQKLELPQTLPSREFNQLMVKFSDMEPSDIHGNLTIGGLVYSELITPSELFLYIQSTENYTLSFMELAILFNHLNTYLE